ncbi:tubulin/FtsZ family protein [Chloroflexota bacterium]
MKLVVIGFGQCGGRISDGFARLNRRAHGQRGIEIIPDAFAVNTDTDDLAELSVIKADHRRRILIGGQRTRGHGVAKMNELAAEIARDDISKVIGAIGSIKNLFEINAFLVVAGAAGGTGSGAISITTKLIREKYTDKPVYAIIVLPFEHEETEERVVYNTGLCLKSIYSVADAVFLIDNQRFIQKDSSLRNNMAGINEMIVEPFYNLLCAGEEKKPRRIGAKVLDAGDIMATLSGWTTIGYSKSQISAFKLLFGRSRNYRKRGDETNKEVSIMGEAFGELSIHCNPKDATRALYLISAPARKMNLDLIKDLGDYLKDAAPDATIRSGDYPNLRGEMEVVVILSALRDVEKVREYYIKSVGLADEKSKMQQSLDSSPTVTEDISKYLPPLL